MSIFMSDYSDRHSSSSSSQTVSNDSEPSYTLKTLKDYLARRKFYVKTQFVADDDTIIFIKVHSESIGENILIYFPSKYSVPKESGNIQSVELVPYELTDKDLLSIQEQEEKENTENYSELQIDDLKDKDSYSDEQYKPISIDSNKEYIIRKSMVRYIGQLNKFKNCTTHIKYKFAILTDNALCVINRYNETECYLIKNGSNLVQNIIDTKTDTVVPIVHELYIMIDLPSFYEKINHVPDDVIKIHRNFYNTLNRAHTKQTALVEHRFKNYQLVITRLLAEYTKNNKYLDLLQSLSQSLEIAIKQEDQLIQKIDIIKGTKEKSTLVKDTEKSFKISKNEQELQRIREIKTKNLKLLHEIKARYHNFLLTFDSTIIETCMHLKQIEEGISRLGIVFDKK